MSAVPPAFKRYGTESLSQAPAFGSGKNGIFEATLVREPGGETRLLRDYTKVPYHVTGTLDTDPADGLTTVCLQEPTGGVAQGDRHSIDVTVRERALAHITTQSATKVHSMHANYAHLDITLEAAADAYLEYLPGPTILNENARCLQTIEVEMADTSIVIIGDVLIPDGLSEHDPFEFDHYHSRLEARCDGELVCTDTADLRPTNGNLQDPATVGEYGVVGSLYVLAPDADSEALSETLYERIAAIAETQAGTSTLPYNAGVVVRVLGHRSTDVTETLTAAWDSARQAMLSVGAPADRRY